MAVLHACDTCGDTVVCAAKPEGWEETERGLTCDHCLIVDHEPQGEAAYYTAQRVHYLITHWADVLTRAESPSTSEGLMLPGPTPESPRIQHQLGHHSDQTRWCDVVADIERARDRLPHEQRTVIGSRMDGLSLERIAAALRKRHSHVSQCYWLGVAMMSKVLTEG